MRILAILLNLFILGFIAVMIIKEGLPKDEGILFALLFTISAVVNLYVIMSVKTESYLFLYFKRKAAEERNRIAKLEKE